MDFFFLNCFSPHVVVHVALNLQFFIHSSPLVMGSLLELHLAVEGTNRMSFLQETISLPRADVQSDSTVDCQAHEAADDKPTRSFSTGNT